jgi:tetratricopeptide (TPR) repeat protein
MNLEVLENLSRIEENLEPLYAPRIYNKPVTTEIPSDPRLYGQYMFKRFEFERGRDFLEQFLESLDTNDKKINDLDSWIINDLGCFEYKLSNFEKAITYYEKAINFEQDKGNENTIATARILLQISLIHKSKAQFVKCLEYLDSAKNILES